jgi:hypothetical protein
MVTMTKDDFKALTDKQHALLCYQGWQFGSVLMPQPQKQVVKKLIEKGFVVDHVVNIGGVSVSEYEVPFYVHMQYCQHCADSENGVVGK